MSQSLNIQRAASPFELTLPRCEHFINGTHDAAAPHGTQDVVDPARGRTLTEIPLGGGAEVDRAVTAGLDAQPAWGAKTPGERSAVLLELADALEADKENLMQLEAANCGKLREVADDDITSVIDTFRFTAGAGRATNTASAGDYVDDIFSVMVREPLGVVGLVTPWNYPLLMVAWKVAPALMMGNAVVLKSSEVTPLTTLRFVELAQNILPAGLLNVVLGTGEDVGKAISSHPDISLVALTGSVRAGKSVAEQASENLARVHLELGGKAPVLVTEEADVEKVVDTVFEAGYWNSGQECGAACRIIAHESLAEQIGTQLAAKLADYQLADPEVDTDGAFGPIIFREHFNRVSTAIAGALERGATVLAGGNYDDAEGFWVETTLLAVDAGDEITTHEVFGPVVTIETFTDLDEAIERANGTVYGLAGSVFTENVSDAINLSRRLDFGSVNVNTHLALPTEMPWSGFKQSGYGRDLSAYALEDYSRIKHVAIQH